jgi:ketosteroid isomerase-like protein
MIRSLAAAAIVASLLPQVSSAQCSDADKAALVALDSLWSVATVTGDAAALGRYMGDNYAGLTLVTTNDKAGTIANSVRNAAAAKLNPNPNANRVTTDRFVVSCTPSTATISHRTVSAPQNGGQPAYSRAFHFMEKRGNQWQAVSSMNSAVSPQQELIYFEMDWNDAAKRHDAAWFEANYAPFATDVSGLTGGIDRKTAAVESVRSDKRVYESLELSELTTRVEGDAAVVTGVNHVKGKDAAGKAFDRRVRFTDTFIKRDGKWMVWATQGTEIK